jgi:hypothetical protein
MTISPKWRTILIFLAWIGSVAFTLLFAGARPFVIDEVDGYCVSDEGAMLATCARQTSGAKSAIRFWDLRQGALHSEFEVPFVRDGWVPEVVIFSTENKRARAFGQEFDLVNKTSLPRKEIPYTKELPETVPWDQIFYDEHDRLIARWSGEYRDTATMMPLYRLELPEDWHTKSPHGNLIIFYVGKSITIVDAKRRTTKTIDLSKNYEDGFGIAPTGDYCGYFETNREYHLFSVDEGTVRKIALPADYSRVEISPRGVYLSCQDGAPPSWLDQGLEKLGIFRPSTWHLIDPNSGGILYTFQGDNHDSVLNPMFTADSSFVLGFDPMRSRLSVWELPIQDRTTLKVVLLIGFSVAASAAIYKTRKKPL